MEIAESWTSFLKSNLCLLIGLFNSVYVVINMVGFTSATLRFVLYMSHVFSVPLFLFSCFLLHVVSIF